MRTTVLLPCAIAAIAALAPAQSFMEDVLWVASRGAVNLTKLSRYGERLDVVDMTYNGFGLRRVHRHPNGNLWLINYITNTFTILDRNGKLIKNVPTAGTAYDVAFDKQGDGWMSMSNLGTVEQYDAAGNLLQSYAVGTNPLGVTVDYNGDVWVAHRNNAPSFITKITPATAKWNNFPLPATSKMMPTMILADFQGFGKPSTIWVGGDRSNELVQFDTNGAVLNTYYPYPSGYPTGLTIDRDNNIWVTSSTYDVVRMRSTDGKILVTFKLGSSVGGVAMDSIGRPWVVDRYATATESAILRHGLSSGLLEAAVPVGSNTYGIIDAAGFHYAYVVNPFGDADADGAANVTEILLGSSPYNPLSSPSLGVDTNGSYRIGGACTLDANSTTAGVLGVFMGLKRGPGYTIPGVGGQLLLDPTRIVGFTSFPAPGSLPLAIPNDPILVGGVIQMQGVFIDPAMTARFANLTGVAIIQ